MSFFSYKTDEELYKDLDEISEAYSKPATNSELLFVYVWLILVPFVGIMGFVFNLTWLFYIAGGISTLTEIFLFFTGALRCLGSVLFVVSCIIGYSITSSLWTGVLLGSCIVGFVLSISYYIVLRFFNDN